MNTDTPDLTNLMEWNRFSDEEKTLLEALTILNNRHRQAIHDLNQRLTEKDAQIVALREALTEFTSWESGMDDSSFHDIPRLLAIARGALSTPPPAVVPLEDVRNLVEAAEKVRHWHDTNEGVIVSAKSFWGLREAISTFTAKHPL